MNEYFRQPESRASRKISGSLCGCVFLSLLLVGLLLLAGCGAPSAKSKTKIVMFEAGSLMVPYAAIEKAFEAENPDIDVEIEAHGSIQVIRHVTELGVDIDVVAVADSSLIPMLMYATKMDNGKPYASWYIEPARNEFVIAYSANSKYADILTADNWFDILSRPDVKVGLSDPRMDAVGYRTLMMTKLAEKYYGQQGIMSNTVGKYFTTPITSTNTNGIDLIKVPELLDPTSNHMYLRGASLECISLLESGDIDYSFEYISVAKQHHLKYLELPAEINLSDTNYAAAYKTVEVSLDFRRFKSVEPLFEGTPIDYGITIAANSTHQKEAARLIAFILGPEGQRICTENYQPPLIPPQCDNIDALPDILKSFFR